MFEPLKSKLSQVEAKVRGVAAKIKGEITMIEADVKQLEQGVLAPFDKIDGAITKAQTELSNALKPPAG
jgi:hypothetical protein